MAVRFVIGRAGSGKTARSAWGLRLILLVPEQSTFQVERALLETGGLPGSALKSGALQILLKGGTKE